MWFSRFTSHTARLCRLRRAARAAAAAARGFARAILVAASLVVAVAMTLWTVPTTFNVTAVTERLELKTGEGAPVTWVTHNVLVDRDYRGKPETFRGSVAFRPAVRVTVSRVAQGPLMIHAEPTGTGASAADFVLESEEPSSLSGRVVEIQIPDVASRAAAGETIVFPLRGRVDAGRPLGIDTAPSVGVLRSGQVSLLARSLLGGVFEAGATTLGAGDYVSVAGPHSSAVGFVLADERPGLTLGYRVIGEGVRVMRPGGQAYDISNSLRNRLLKDEGLQAVWITFLALLGLTKYLPPRHGTPRFEG